MLWSLFNGHIGERNTAREENVRQNWNGDLTKILFNPLLNKCGLYRFFLILSITAIHFFNYFFFVGIFWFIFIYGQKKYKYYLFMTRRELWLSEHDTLWYWMTLTYTDYVLSTIHINNSFWDLLLNFSATNDWIIYDNNQSNSGRMKLFSNKILINFIDELCLLLLKWKFIPNQFKQFSTCNWSV